MDHAKLQCSRELEVEDEGVLKGDAKSRGAYYWHLTPSHDSHLTLDLINKAIHSLEQIGNMSSFA